MQIRALRAFWHRNKALNADDDIVLLDDHCDRFRRERSFCKGSAGLDPYSIGARLHAVRITPWLACTNVKLPAMPWAA